MRFPLSGLLPLLCCGVGFADIVTQPLGLQPGDTYQLVFVTSGTTAATSTSIASYNAFVTAQAANNPTLAAFDTLHGVTWTAIGSTASIAANVNAPSSGAVYTLDGAQVASPLQPLYIGDGTDSLLSLIDIDQFGAFSMTATWTGDGVGGVSFPSHELGSLDPIFGFSTYGLGDPGTNRAWEFYAPGSVFGYTSATALPMYALSSVITVSGVPEASSVFLLGGVLIVFLTIRSGRRLVSPKPGSTSI